ncbi:hypothetical protein FKW77_000271 [Venturia effusa]|uniref:DUF7820 domain-containing protein n=1 Tax=Venturia effusa TaxID=50376 RepID=A0A517LHV6_9PEZI|nr:hypothetical protein FKW77_000271 [Venturia effusa]
MEPSKRQSRASATDAPNPNIFDDEYAVEVPDIDLEYRVADGFAESAGASEGDGSTRGRSHTPVAQQSKSGRRPIQSSSSSSSSPASREAGERNARTRRSSIAKETRGSESLDNLNLPSLHHHHHGLADTGSYTSSCTDTITAGDASTQPRLRPVSTASSTSFATVDDSHASYRGPSGPSHPYDLFPQAGVPHHSLLSNPSPSRLRPSLYTPSQPAHPYALYQQNPFPVDDSESDIGPAIPVGFPGRNGNFGRQIGPDGEDQGIVGPDGHTEDLPPYSKYPDARTVKPAFAATGSISPVDDGSNVGQSIPRAQDELASPIAAPESPRSLSQTPTRLSAPRAIPSRSSSRDLQTRSHQSSGYSIKGEKAWRDKSWREKRRTRVCGGRLPVWALLVAISILIFIVILVGGVIGGLLAVGKSQEEPPTVTVTSTQSMFDASFIAAPTGLPQLPAGQYVFPLGIPQEQQTACLTSGDQYSAWSCNVPPKSLWGEIVSPPTGYHLWKLYPAPPPPDEPPPRFNFSYGAQPPKVRPNQRVFWVQDLAEPGRGPALHFQTTYDKLVILQEGQFGQGKRKRDVPQYGSGSPTDYTPLGEHRPGESPSVPPPHGGGFHRKSMMLQTGDSPWFCYWNQTFIEGFIYVGQKSTSSGGQSDAGTAAATPTASGSMPTFGITASPAAPTDAPITVTPHQIRAAFAELDAHLKRMASPSPTPTKDYVVPKGSGPPPKFPFVFKLTERRTPGSGQQAGMAPYCQKMFVPAEGAPYPVHDDDGRPTVVHLNENDPSPQDYSTALRKPEKTGAAASSSTPSSAQRRSLNSLSKREDPPKSCHCLWVSPVGP